VRLRHAFALNIKRKRKRRETLKTRKRYKTKAPNSDYHKLEPPVAARQAQVARDYLKRAARID